VADEQLPVRATMPAGLHLDDHGGRGVGEQRIWETWSRSGCAGCTRGLVSSQQSGTAGRDRAVTKSLTATNPGKAA
jgi:hypothetical protein